MPFDAIADVACATVIIGECHEGPGDVDTIILRYVCNSLLEVRLTGVSASTDITYFIIHFRIVGTLPSCCRGSPLDRSQVMAGTARVAFSKNVHTTLHPIAQARARVEPGIRDPSEKCDRPLQQLTDMATRIKVLSEYPRENGHEICVQRVFTCIFGRTRWNGVLGEEISISRATR